MAVVNTSSFPVKKIIAVIGIIVTVNAIIWLVAGLTYAKIVPQGTALLVIAYTLGLRHALDADHIAAIDNVTRRLVQAGQKPVTVGLFFSLGHSSIVIIATILVAALSAKIEEKFKRDIVEPKSNQLITQGTWECAAASLSMLINIPFKDVKDCLTSLGWQNDEEGLGIDSMTVATKILINKTLTSSFENFYDPSILTVPSINLKGRSHAVFWDGKELLDPQFHNENKKHYSPLWTPDTLFFKNRLFLKD